jgi:Xaa-Pro aminopeptidase
MRNRSKGFSYTPIIGSGNNANVLHYVENNQQCKSGDLILIDWRRVRKYSSDMTRTIPVSGKTMTDKKPFTMPFYALRKLLKCLSQEHWKQYHIEVGKLMTSEPWFRSSTKLTCKTKTQTSLHTKNISCTEHRTMG